MDVAGGTLLAGQRLGRYVLQRRVAAGSIGEVWVALEEAGLVVQRAALKIVEPELAADAAFAAAIAREAQAASGLQHENIGKVFGAFAADGCLALVMAYIDGRDLRRVLSALSRARERPPLGLALAVARDVALALAFAHGGGGAHGASYGGAHGDVSSNNVMIATDGSVKLVDFGLAAARVALAPSLRARVEARAGVRAPEQADGAPPSPRADLFALGVMLWEMLAMDRLFKGEREEDVREAVRRAVVRPIRQVDPEVPRAAEELLAALLSRAPEDRPASAVDVLGALEALMGGPAGPEALGGKRALAGWIAAWLHGGRPPPGRDGNVPAVGTGLPLEDGGERAGAEASSGVDPTVAEPDATLFAPQAADAPANHETTIPDGLLAGDTIAVAEPGGSTRLRPTKLRLPTRSEIIRAVEAVVTQPMIVPAELPPASSGTARAGVGHADGLGPRPDEAPAIGLDAEAAPAPATAPDAGVASEAPTPATGIGPGAPVASEAPTPAAGGPEPAADRGTPRASPLDPTLAVSAVGGEVLDPTLAVAGGASAPAPVSAPTLPPGSAPSGPPSPAAVPSPTPVPVPAGRSSPSRALAALAGIATLAIAIAIAIAMMTRSC